MEVASITIAQAILESNWVFSGGLRQIIMDRHLPVLYLIHV